MIIFVSSSVALANWGDTVTVGDDTVTLSNNVQGDYKKSTDNTTFSSATYNKLGTNIYGVASNSNLIRYKECDKKPCGTIDNSKDPVSSGDSGDFTGSGWSDLGE